MWRLAILAAAALASPASAAELTAEEIRGELVGATIDWWEEGGWHAGALVLHPDGAAQIRVETPDSTSEIGSWTLDGNRICTRWPSLRSGSAKCYSVRRIDALRFATSGGNLFELRLAGV